MPEENAPTTTQSEAVAQQQACSGLLAELKRHRAQMAPHHKDREAGRLLLGSITALEEMDKKVSLLCEEWADDHTHLQKLCRKHGCTEDEVEGSSYGVPGIMELADLLDAKLSQNAPHEPRRE